jgi:ferredoxin-NADP reductase
VPTPRLTLRWQVATVVAIRDETPSARTFRFRLPAPHEHLPGQHYAVRLTAPDGYTATRSYSVASAPDPTGEIELTVEKLPGGEVSEFLHDIVVVGDEIEMRGPIGNWFAWRGDAPALLVGGGSGVVPLMAMLRAARAAGRPDLLRLVVAARSPAELYYADELPGPEVTVTYSRATSPYGRAAGRLTEADLAPHVRGGEDVYVCGSPPFCDATTYLLTQVGVPVDAIRVERFGAT